MEQPEENYHTEIRNQVLAEVEEEKNKINLLRILCTRCDAVMNNIEKLRIISKLERGVNHKVHCSKCIKEINDKYLEKNKDGLIIKRKFLRDLVNEDKKKYGCSCQGSCKGLKKVIYHRKRNREVQVGAITMKDYKENCEILCLVELPQKIAGLLNKAPLKQFDYIKFIKDLDYKVLFDKILDFQLDIRDWLFENDIELIQNFELYTFQNTQSKFSNNIELLLVANKKNTLEKKVVYSSSSFGEKNKDEVLINNVQFELRYCINKFLDEIKYENLLAHYKTYKVPECFLGENGKDIRLEVMQPLTLNTYENLK